MTILEAIFEVLNRNGHGLTCKAITEQILQEKLYSFNTPNPNTMVGHCLRKHCKGLTFASAHPIKHFVIVSGKRETAVYWLLSKTHETSDSVRSNVPISSDSDLLPEEKMQKNYDAHVAAIKEQLLDSIMNNAPDFFEQLVVKLLLELGYGYGTDAGKVVGKSHDGGIDGIINEDKLGLDKIYIQAKRYSSDNKVGSKEIQAFAGAMKGINKGVFITTSSFTKAAQKEAYDQPGKQIALVDGNTLTDLMLRAGVGIHTVKSFDTYEIDSQFFDIGE